MKYPAIQAIFNPKIWVIRALLLLLLFLVNNVKLIRYSKTFASIYLHVFVLPVGEKVLAQEQNIIMIHSWTVKCNTVWFHFNIDVGVHKMLAVL